MPTATQKQKIAKIIAIVVLVIVAIVSGIKMSTETEKLNNVETEKTKKL